MYQALYRKWRPRTFDDVVGQEHITETLKNQVVHDRLSHAYLFTGTRGTGKTTCAKILAKAVNCENPQNGNPCNACASCMGIDDGSVMDVVEMDAASNNGVDNVRQLRDEAVFSPASAKKRVYIVDEVHMLSVSAFNALLKILEEPPAHLMFILATTELNKVPATILSRCQRHSFKRLDTASITARLRYVAEREGFSLSDGAASLIAGLSEGGMRDALSMLDQCAGRDKIDTETVYSALGLAGNRQTGQLLRHIAAHEPGEAIALFEALWQEGKNPATVLGELASLQRDLLLRAVAPKGGRELLSGGFDDALLDSLAGSFPAGALIANIERIQQALDAMRTGQARTVCELCLIALSEPELNDSLPMLRQRVSALEQRLSAGGPVSVPAAPPPRPVAKAPVPAQPEPPLPEEPPPLLEDPCPDDFGPPPPEFGTPPEVDVPHEVCAPPAPPPSPAPPHPVAGAGSRELWERMQGRLEGSFPRGLIAILTDSAMVEGVLRDNTLSLTVNDSFALHQLNRPDVLSRLSEIASAQAGAVVKVVVADPAANAAQQGSAKLDELAKYPIVHFT